MKKSEVKRFIKENGTVKFDGTVEATINGKNYGYYGNTIVCLDSYTKFPTFDEVFIESKMLVFYNGHKTNSYDMEMRESNEVVDQYWSLIEAMNR